MYPLRINPETGYLETKGVTERIFDSPKKIKFLTLAHEAVKRRELPEIHMIAEAVGISTESFYDHLRRDKKFAGEWREIRLKVNSILEKELYSKAMNKMGIVANLAWLKRLESGSWIDQNRIIHSNENAGLKDINSQFLDAVDAEIVPNSESAGTPRPEITNDSDSTT